MNCLDCMPTVAIEGQTLDQAHHFTSIIPIVGLFLYYRSKISSYRAVLEFLCFKTLTVRLRDTSPARLLFNQRPVFDNG